MKSKAKDNSNKIKTWMIAVIIIFGSILGGIIASLFDYFYLQKHIKSVGARFGIMFLIAVIFSIIILSVLGSQSSQRSQVFSVNVNGIDYHYYNPQTGANWAYFAPLNFSMAEGSSVNGSYPFTSNPNCSMTFTNAYSLTPGFIYLVHGLPITFFPSTPTDFNITLIAPSYSYTGPLNVEIYVNYTCST